MDLLNRCAAEKPKNPALTNLNGGGISSFLLVRLFGEIAIFCKNYLPAGMRAAEHPTTGTKEPQAMLFISFPVSHPIY